MQDWGILNPEITLGVAITYRYEKVYIWTQKSYILGENIQNDMDINNTFVLYSLFTNLFYYLQTY